MAREATSATAPKRKAVKRVAKPKRAWVVVEGITAEEFAAYKPEVVLTQDEMLTKLEQAIDQGKKIARIPVIIPVKTRSKPEGGAPTA